MPPTDDFEQRRAAARDACRSSLFGHGWPTPGELLAGLAAADAGDNLDRYGKGGAVTALEQEVADLLGKPAAAFMPSGIMAQQCVLRAWSERTGSSRIALHGLSHLVLHELNALPELHGFDTAHLTFEPRQPTPNDLAALTDPLGAVTLELPLRDGGFKLPTWDELTAFAEACRDRDVPLHLDGARIWESAPHLGRPLDEIAAIADTMYVSFYKGLGGLAGAAVAGPTEVIDEARSWQRRHGGTLFTLLPYAVAAREGLRTQLPRMAEYHDTAVDLAKRLTAAGLRVDPDPPHTNAFRVYADAPADDVNERVLTDLEATHEMVFPWFQAGDVPGWSWTEFWVGSATCDRGVADVATRIAQLTIGGD
ncbi:MAG TPA: beta-eliminating lyase-related protein [Nocardioidaceae bacterium]|nr:beta-eliminating lyase-related protein [Nocardioidaceae bacterium]